MTTGWWSVVLAVLAAVLVVVSQVWAHRTSGLGPLLPLLAGLATGVVGGVVGLVGLLVARRRRRDDRLEQGLCIAGLLVGVACVVLVTA